MDRLFLDANVLFSAAYRPNAGLLQLWKLRGAVLCSSRYALEEARINSTDEAQKRRLSRLARSIQLFDPPDRQPDRQPGRQRPADVSFPDPLDLSLPEAVGVSLPEAVAVSLPKAVGVSLPEKDWPIFSAALAARATHLITGDVRHFGPYFGKAVHGILIMTPARYLKTRRRSQ
jgi:predicted nucleic acid-binding protein